MNIKPTYSVPYREITYNNDLVATLLQRRNVELSGIRVKDGETMVIGGLIQESENKTANKAPLLGDIPVLGWFFRSTTSKKEKSELILMITPHIIQDTDDIVKFNETEAL